MLQLRNYLLFTFVLALLSGCSSTGDHSSMASKKFESHESIDRFVIRSASLEIEVKDPAATADEIKALIEREKGYVDNAYNRNQESVSLTVKIPEARLEQFVDEVSAKGKVIVKNMNARDVTEEMIDMDARLKNLLSLRDRFRALLAKANTVAEVIDVEKELTRIQSEIDAIEGRGKALRNQVAYSEVRITITRKTIYGPLGYVFKGLFWTVGKLFVLN